MNRLASAFLVVLGVTMPAVGDEAYKRMMDDPLGYSGPTSPAIDKTSVREVPLGLFAPAEGSDPVATALNRGAGLAVELANRSGGLGGVPFRLIRRWAADPWSGGAGEVVRLVYDDRVWAVIGSVDGASTHVAEQVVTKARVPLLVPVASDPSLTRARIPWIFRLPPDGDAQARLLVRRGVVQRGLRRLAIVTSTDHAGRVRAIALLKSLHGAGRPPVLHLTVPASGFDPFEVCERVERAAADGVMLGLDAVGAGAVIEGLRHRGVACTVLLPWIPGSTIDVLAAGAVGEVVAIAPFSSRSPNIASADFVDDYRSRWGMSPPAVAVYARDAVQLVVDGLRAAGLSRTALRDRLAGRTDMIGLSGPIRWDSGGGNTVPPVFARQLVPKR